jgi:homogentisate 1,2-dioxygenase
VLYYVEGNFGSRKGIDIGSFTAHPQGIPHGPHPGTVEASMQHTRTEELAVMVDTFRPLHPTKVAGGLDDAKYPASWEGEHFPGLTGDAAKEAARLNGEAKFPARLEGNAELLEMRTNGVVTGSPEGQ